MQSLIRLAEIAKKHHHVPDFKDKTRYKGIVLSAAAWLLYAVFTYLIEQLNPSFSAHSSIKSISKMFIEFSIMHFSMFIVFFVGCLKSGGVNYLRPKEPKLIAWRSTAAVLSFWCYAFARVWASTIDNSLQYSTDAFWVLLILWYLKQKISKFAAMGIILGTLGIGYVYFTDSRSIYDLFGGVFGMGAGMTLAIITVITTYLVKQDPPLRIGLFQSTLGCVTSLLIGLAFGSVHGFDFISIKEIMISLITGGILSILLYMIWQSFYYTEPYILGALSYILPVFLIFSGWVLGETPMNRATAIGTIIITLGGCMAVFDSYIHHKNQKPRKLKK